MKKLLKPLFTALFAGMVCTGAKAAEPQVINIRTNDLSMVMSVAPNGEVLFHHFGGRIDDASPAAGIKSYRRTDHGTDNLAYSTMGGRNFREPALRVTHADGDMNTELRYVSHATRTLADKNVSETVVKLTDTNQALDVELVYTAYAKENVITTHTVIRNREKGDAVLHAFYSSSLPVKARSYLLTHLYGSWARESQTDHTLLTHGSKSIESRKLVRTTHTENPAFMVTLDSEAFDENGGGGGGDDKNQDQNKEQQGGQDRQNGDQQKDDQQKDDKGQGDDKEQQGDPQQNPAQPDKEQEGDQQGEPQPVPAGISPQEQEQMLDAIQAQEDRTQDKLKEKQGVVVRGSKNW